MKNVGKSFLASALLIAIINIFSINKVSAQDYDDVSLDLFYDELSPYGNWDDDPNYGEIWYPDVESNFRPYGSNGYWTMTQYGNTWVSNYAWGWAPFHYGRWVQTPRHGWGWIPGYEWGPAWVDWRSGNGYYGWAPMAPRLSVNISIGLPIDLWIFAPTRRIYDRNIYRHSHYGRPNIYNNTTIINNTYIVNNHHYYGGPSRRHIEHSTGRRVAVRDMQYSSRRGVSRVDNNSVSIYRPDRNSSSTSRRSESVNRNEGISSSQRPQNTSRGQREMYIGKDGDAVIRNRRENQTTNNSSRQDNSSRRENNILENRNSTRTERPRQNSNTDQYRGGSRNNNDRYMEQNRGNTSRVESSRENSSRREQPSVTPQIRQRESRPQQESPRRSSAPSTVIHSASRNSNGNERGSISRSDRGNTSSNRGSVQSSTSRRGSDQTISRGSR